MTAEMARLMWMGSIAAVPMAVGVWLACAAIRHPATRHALWLVVLATFTAPLVASAVGLPRVVDPSRLRLSDDGAARSPTIPASKAGAPIGGAIAAAEAARIEPSATVAGALERSPTDLVVPSPSRIVRVAPERVARNPAGGLRGLRRSEQVVDRDVPGDWVSETRRESVSVPPPVTNREEIGERATDDESAGVTWRGWISSLAAARDAVAAVPAPPVEAWVASLIVILTAVLGRMVRRARWYRAAEAAPAEVEEMVHEGARLVGLRRAPAVRMSRGRISPMICCGVRPTLVMPAELWADLDGRSRMAVIVHELAHLKRRDHWTCWVESAVCLVYWWHPVAWWARRRLREEADLSCDAWVTALLPRCRRAYAEALLATNRFVSEAGARAPASALGMASPGARRFARRLTMVMTHRIRPRMSRVRSVGVGSIALGVLLVMPGLAGQPESVPAVPVAPSQPTRPIAQPEPVAIPAETPLPAVAPALPGRSVGVAIPSSVSRSSPTIPAQPTAPSHVSQPGGAGMVPARTPAPPSGYAGASVASGVEDRIAALEARLAQLERAARGLSAMAEPRVPIVVRPSIECDDDCDNDGDGCCDGDCGCAGVSCCDGEAGLTSADLDDGEVIVRRYALPRGKLDALAGLMIRDDVPIRVRHAGDAIEVHATSRQHEVFRAFCQMLDSDGVRVSGQELRLVPELQAVLERHEAMMERAAASRAEAAAARTEAEALRAEMRNREREARQVSDEADRLERRAERLHQQAESIRERVEDRDGAGRDEMLRHADGLMQEAAALIEEAERLRTEAEAAEARNEMLDWQAEDAEERAEMLEEEAREYEEEARQATAVRVERQ